MGGGGEGGTGGRTNNGLNAGYMKNRMDTAHLTGQFKLNSGWTDDLYDGKRSDKARHEFA